MAANDRQRIAPDDYVVFHIDDFYAFCKDLWGKSPGPESVVIEDLAEAHDVVLNRTLIISEPT